MCGSHVGGRCRECQLCEISGVTHWCSTWRQEHWQLHARCRWGVEPALTSIPATVPVSGHGEPIEHGLLHTLVEAVCLHCCRRAPWRQRSTSASNHRCRCCKRRHLTGGVVHLCFTWCRDSWPLYAGCQCKMFLLDALYHACARVCSLAPYTWPIKCHIQVPLFSLECSCPCDMHRCFSGACFWSTSGPVSVSHSLDSAHIWRTLMFYQVLPSAVRHRQTWHNFIHLRQYSVIVVCPPPGHPGFAGSHMLNKVCNCGE